MKVLYLTGYLENTVMAKRNNKNMFFQSGVNKTEGIIKSLKLNHTVTVLSHGYVKNKSFKLFKAFCTRTMGIPLIYSAIIDVPILNMVSSIISSVKNIRMLQKKRGIDVLIFYNYRPETALPALLANILLKIPIVVEYEDGFFADRDLKLLKRIMINIIEFFTYRRLRGAILVNENLKERINTDNYFVCRGIYDPDNRRGINLNSENSIPVVMYSGRYDYERGIEVFLESLRYIAGNIIVKLTGYGPLNDYVSNKIEQLKVENSNLNIVKYNFLAREELEDQFKNADILINPQRITSNFSRYSFPSKLIEYMSYGKIIVSTDVGNIKENVFVKYYGDDPVQLANKVNDIIFNLNKYSSYRKNTIRFLETECSIEHYGKELDRLLSNVVDGNE